MAFVRPIVYVYQELASVVVSPASPDQNGFVVGPAFHIQDYPADKTDIYIDEFIKSGYTMNAPCANSDGSSLGRPDPNTDFVTISDPPGHSGISGIELDASSVVIVFDDVLIELTKGIDGAVTENSNSFTGTGDFVNKKVVAGDRLVLTKDTASPTEDDTVVATVKSVSDASTLLLTSTIKAADIAKIGTADIRFRVEHQLDDQEIDSAYFSIVGNATTIKTLADDLRVTYQSTTWPVNYAKIYMGYRALRTDLASVLTINETDDIAGTLGRIDERNPLAVGVNVALANTDTPIKAYGVTSDDLTGHQSARDAISTRDDIYAITPVTDELSGSSWVSVITMWKTHCELYDDYDRAKYRVVLGSYDILPTEKASAPPSLVGYTLLDPVNTDLYDVFIDPHEDTQFLIDEVTSSHLLDIGHETGSGDLGTMGAGGTDTPFTAGSAPYGGARELLGTIGDKRIRLAAASKFAGEHTSAVVGNYAVRNPILKSEGATPVADTSAVSLAVDGGTGKLRITKSGSGAFASVLTGDIAHVTNCTTPANEGGFVVLQKIDDDEIEVAWEAADAGVAVEVQVYRPVAAAAAAGVTASNAQVAATGVFTSAAPGDILYILRAAGAGIPGMFIISNVIDNDTAVIAAPSTVTLADDADIDVALFRAASANPAGTSLYGRRRLTRLRDDTASFLSTVNAGELIEIPYPAETDDTKWDTSTTTWPVETVVSNELLDADLEELEELAPDTFTEGFDGDMSYRIAITLDRDAQVTELGTITEGIQSFRCIMTWPNEVLVSGVQNELTEIQSRQKGQYLACAVCGMTAGLPSQQGFTFIGIGGIEQIFNSNLYFTDDQLTSLRNKGWYVFVQDSESSPPYTIHEVTTDVSTYEYGEYMFVKNFDFVAQDLKLVLEKFIGRYNITNETLNTIRSSLDNRIAYLKQRTYPKIGGPIRDAEIAQIIEHPTELDQVDCYIEGSFPRVMNKIGLYIKG